MKKRRIGVVTTSRADYGIYRPVLTAIAADPELELVLLVTGMHLAPEFGHTVRAIEADGFPIAERVEMLLASDSPEAVSKSMGLGTIGFSQVYARSRPDILLVLGDRFEMLAAAVAAMPFAIPIAHIHGGETTQGLIDEAIRHSITKMSHLHFAATDVYARRIVQMGEQPWRVTCTGAPSLDNLHTLSLLDRDELAQRIGAPIADGTLLVTFHPVTLEYDQTAKHVDELLAALAASGRPLIFTYPNADTAGRQIIERIREFVTAHHHAVAVANLGTQGYFSLLAQVTAMVGNSSSGIAEAASFQLPVVNIGNRQGGRLHGHNVLDCPCERHAIQTAIERATSAEFIASLAGMKNPYGDGTAAAQIVARLKSIELNAELLLKRFWDLPEVQS